MLLKMTHTLTLKCWIAEGKISLDALEPPYHTMQLLPPSISHPFHQLPSGAGPTSRHTRTLLPFF